MGVETRSASAALDVVFVWFLLAVAGMIGALASGNEARRAVTPEDASRTLCLAVAGVAGDARDSGEDAPPCRKTAHC